MHVINLFSGAGGCSLGLTKAGGFTIRLAADIDGDACATYAANVRNAPIWRADLSETQPIELLRRAGLNQGQVDLMVGGPPCQGLTSAGARDWEDPRNKLLRKFADAVTHIKPTWFIMENVEGLLTAKDGFFLVETLTRFLEAGYWVRAEKVYMERYGVPQRRKRVVIVGNREKCAFTFPVATHREFVATPSRQLHLPGIDELVGERDLSHPLSVLDAISDLPEVSASRFVVYDRDAENMYQLLMRRADSNPVSHHETRDLNALAQQRVQLLAQGATMKSLPIELQHRSWSKRANRRVKDGTPTERRGGAPSGLKRLIGTDPSLTITSAATSEFVHPISDRLLTLRECARIQTFPDWFSFRGNWSSVAIQIGNAIPPLYMEMLARHICSVATWRPVEQTMGRWLGINATKSTGLSPVLARVLTELEEKTVVYA